ncbi:MAG: HNH endonuclease, partial [Pirellulales bacterium]
MQRTTEERFWEKVDRRGTNECWEWQAGKDKDGYGRFWFVNETVKAHRFSYELHKGDIPEGLYVLHSCHNTSCVSPNHLRV